MPIQVDGVLLHTITGTELSRVRTELEGRRVLAAIPPHPVQASPQPSSHRYLGNVPLPAHGQAAMAAQLGQSIGKPWEVTEQADADANELMTANFSLGLRYKLPQQEATVAGGEVTIRALVRISFLLE